MQIAIVNNSDRLGGASRAAYSLCRALRANGMDASMHVTRATGDANFVKGSAGTASKAWGMFRYQLALQIMRAARPADKALRSIALLPWGRVAALNRDSVDLVNLHWLGDDCLSIEELRRIEKPIVWTMHDMWVFAGAEHYVSDSGEARIKGGYRKVNRNPADRGLDIDGWVWRRKKRAWVRPIHLIAPSQWLANQASTSALASNWPIHVIPNPLDLDVFRPIDQSVARELLGLPRKARLIAFGAERPDADPRKGFDLLLEALRYIQGAGVRDTHCAIFGRADPGSGVETHLPVHWLGRLTDDLMLALVYSAADVTIVPSRQENLPQTATEAQSCGCPVVAFDCTGLGDTVEDGVTGILARPYDTAGLASGILTLLNDQSKRRSYSRAARKRAQSLWAPEVVAAQYSDVFEAAIASYTQRRR